MKKIYDKLLFLLAVLALLGGAAFYVLNSNAAANMDAGAIPLAAANSYQPVPIPETPESETVWPEPEHQSSGPDWLYDVFTPPKIYLDAEGNFTAEPPKVVGPPEAFGITLAAIERIPYRIQMQGYSGDRKKPAEAVLFFFDEERELRFLIREGETNAESEVEVLDFEIRRVVDTEQSSVNITAIARILDKRSGQELQLNDEERLFNPEVAVVFRSEEDPAKRFELTVDPAAPETSFETPAGEFVLRQINLEERTVTVEKRPTEESEARIRTLLPQTYNAPETQAPQSDGVESQDAPAGAVGENVFDLF